MTLRLPWPLPAFGLAAWHFVHCVVALVARVGHAALPFGHGASVWGDSWWRRGLIAAGFPLSLALVAVALPALAWLVPLALLLLVYPLNAWRDAPLFPRRATLCRRCLAQAPLAPAARCWMLVAAWAMAPGAAPCLPAGGQLDGIEWSWPLRGLRVALPCPGAPRRYVEDRLERLPDGVPVPAARKHGPRAAKAQAEMAPAPGW